MPICRCCTAPTARSSQSATAPRRCRSCARPATCPPRSATISLCSAGAPTTTRRSCSTAELVERFSIERVGRSSAIFDQRKLRWLNGASCASSPLDEYVDAVAAAARAEGHADGARRPRPPAPRCAIAQDKAQTLSEVWPLIGSCSSPRSTTEGVAQGDGPGLGGEPAAALERLRAAEPFDAPDAGARAGGVRRAPGRQAARTSTSRCGSRSRAPRSRPGSSTRSRRSGARNRSAGSSKRSSGCARTPSGLSDARTGLRG